MAIPFQPVEDYGITPLKSRYTWICNKGTSQKTRNIWNFLLKNVGKVVSLSLLFIIIITSIIKIITNYLHI